MTFNHLPQKESLSLEIVLRIAFHKEFPICHEVLNIWQTATAFQRISPPFFIQARLQQYSRRRSFYSAHRSFSNTTRLSALPTARETFLNSFPSLEKLLFCTDEIESIERLDLVARLRIDLPHWGLHDLLLSRSPCDLGSQADFAISIFREVSANSMLS